MAELDWRTLAMGGPLDIQGIYNNALLNKVNANQVAQLPMQNRLLQQQVQMGDVAISRAPLETRTMEQQVQQNDVAARNAAFTDRAKKLFSTAKIAKRYIQSNDATGLSRYIQTTMQHPGWGEDELQDLREIDQRIKSGDIETANKMIEDGILMGRQMFGDETAQISQFVPDAATGQYVGLTGYGEPVSTGVQAPERELSFASGGGYGADTPRVYGTTTDYLDEAGNPYKLIMDDTGNLTMKDAFNNVITKEQSQSLGLRPAGNTIKGGTDVFNKAMGASIERASEGAKKAYTINNMLSLVEGGLNTGFGSSFVSSAGNMLGTEFGEKSTAFKALTEQARTTYQTELVGSVSDGEQRKIDATILGLDSTEGALWLNLKMAQIAANRARLEPKYREQYNRENPDDVWGAGFEAWKMEKFDSENVVDGLLSEWKSIQRRMRTGSKEAPPTRAQYFDQKPGKQQVTGRVSGRTYTVERE